MTKQRAPFIPMEIDDDDIEKLAAAKGVATMVRPAAPVPHATPAVPTAAEREGEAQSSPKPDQPAVRPGATPRNRMKAINLELPDYVWTDLKIRAAHAQTSVRHIIMKALRANGVTIAEVDMVEDGRRLRT